MSAVADTGALYVLYDAGDRDHQRVREALQTIRGPIYVPTALLAEIDYLLREWLGVDAELAFLASLKLGAFQLEEFTKADLLRCEELLSIYRDLDLGLADAAVVATAERLKVNTVLSLDERDFRAVRSKLGPFRLLPADL
jgi:predicted nucleic acid-binding protein